MSEAEEFFTEFLFGVGAPLGAILIIILLALFVLRVKYGAMVSIPASAIMMILYLDNIPVTSIAMWNIFLMFLSMVLSIALEVKR